MIEIGNVQQTAGALLQRLDNGLTLVAERIHGNTTPGVQVLAPCMVIQPNALPSLQDKLRTFVGLQNILSFEFDDFLCGYHISPPPIK
jgi:hypothetical protein